MIFQPKSISLIAEQFLNNEVGIFPFDTLLGLTGLANKDVITRLESIKKRSSMPFIMIIPDLSYLSDLVEPLTDLQQSYIKKYWPGPVTFIFKKHKHVPDIITSGKPTIGIRFANFLPLKFLLQKINQPILSTSANIHTQPVATTFSELSDELKSQCDFCYDEILPRYNQCSTIVDISTPTPTVLRKGVRSFE